MIKHYLLKEKDLFLKSDLAGEFLLYIYQSKDKKIIIKMISRNDR